MDKKYQVFVSSTYTDLKEERNQVIQALMLMDCIPSGMEAFPAADEKQWEFIKKIIDDCDFYVLIIGGRYGSLSLDGIGYTEKEYHYAVSKGIDVIAFLHASPDELPADQTDDCVNLKAKLESFRAEVQAHRLVKYWNDGDELHKQVIISLRQAIKSSSAIGWVRANKPSSNDIFRDLNELRKKNINFKDLLNDRDASLNTMGYVKGQFDRLSKIGSKEEMEKAGDKDVVDYLDALDERDRKKSEQRLLEYVYVFNRIGAGIKYNALDKDEVFSMWPPTYFQENWKRFRNFIIEKRRNNENAYVFFDWLVLEAYRETNDDAQ